METEVTIIEGPTYQYVPSLDGSYYVKVELVKGVTRVDNYSDREMIYHRTSYSPSVSGEYETLWLRPFGYESVSGTDYTA